VWETERRVEEEIAEQGRGKSEVGFDVAYAVG